MFVKFCYDFSWTQKAKKFVLSHIISTETTSFPKHSRFPSLAKHYFEYFKFENGRTLNSLHNKKRALRAEMFQVLNRYPTMFLGKL